MGMRGSAALFFLLAALPAFCQVQELSLQDAYGRARASSEALRIRVHAVEKTRSAVGQAASRIWPHVTLDGSASYLVNPPRGVSVSKGQLGTITIPSVGAVSVPTSDLVLFNDTPSFYYKVSLILTQPLFTWGRIKNAIDAAALQVEAVSSDLVRQERDLDREVNRAYFSALAARESTRILTDIRDAVAGISQDRHTSFDDGSVTREAVLQADADLEAIQARIVQAEEGGKTARETLGILTGLPPEWITLSTGFRDASPAIDEEQARRSAVETSADLAAARARLRLAGKALEIARGGSMLLPDLSLAMSLDADNGQRSPASGAPNWTSAWEWDLAVSLGVRLNVFDGMESFHKTAQAEKDAAMAGDALAQQEKLLRVAVRKAAAAVLEASADLRQKHARARYLQERARNAGASAEAGLASREDQRGGAVQAGTAELDLLMARFTLEQALADLGQLTGERL
jgi:outer membrane protein